MELCIFSYHCNVYCALRISQIVDHLCPLGKIRFAVLKSQGFQNYIGKFFSFHCKRSFI